MGESGPLLRRRGADHRYGIRHGHCAALALHTHDGIHPSAQSLSGSIGIVLPCKPAQPVAPEYVPTPDVARATSPKQISRSIILLMPIDAADFHVALGTAQRTYSRSRWWARVRPVSKRPVRDVARFLAPRLTTTRPGRSQSSSSPFSSSSSSSSVSSPRSVSRALPIASASSSRVDSGA